MHDLEKMIDEEYPKVLSYVRKCLQESAGGKTSDANLERIGECMDILKDCVKVKMMLKDYHHTPAAYVAKDVMVKSIGPM